MKKIFITSILVAFTMVFLSCKSDDDASDDSTPTQDRMIGLWKLDSAVASGIFYPLANCAKDSNFTFNQDNSGSAMFQYNAIGQNTCSAPQSTSGTWAKVDDSNYKITDQSGVETVYTFNFVDNSTLKYTQTVSGQSMEATFKKQ